MRVLLEGKDRQSLFANNLSSISLSRRLRTSRSMLARYIRGDLLLPEYRFQQLLTLIPVDKVNAIKNKARYIKNNWGQIKGGKKTYTKYRKNFERGRRLGLKKIKMKSKKIDLNTQLTEELCEFIGAFIGDGFTNKYGHVSMTQIAGDKRYDLEYHHYLGSIIEKLFGIQPRIYTKQRTNELRTNFYSRALFLLLVKRFSFPKGKKAKTVLIPEEVISSKDPRVIAAVLRGIFDTDGSIYFDYRKIYKKKYPRIDLHIKNSNLVKQIGEQLKHLDINFSIVEGGSRLQINGSRNVGRYIDLIGFSNQRHTKKLMEITMKEKVKREK